MKVRWSVRPVVLGLSVSVHAAGLYWLGGEYLSLNQPAPTPPRLLVQMSPVAGPAKATTSSAQQKPALMPMAAKAKPPLPDAARAPVESRRAEATQPKPRPKPKPDLVKPRKPATDSRPKPVAQAQVAVPPVTTASVPIVLSSDAETPAKSESTPATEPSIKAPHPAEQSQASAAAVVAARYELGSQATPKPAYPYSARRRGLEGRVLVQIEYDARGIPLQVTLLESSDHPALDRAALETLQGWRLQPGLQDGQPVPGRIQVPIRFALR